MARQTPTQLLSPAPSQRLSFYPASEDFWQSLPSSPGIYIFENADKKPLYIGKSINLRTRLRQHYEGFTTGSTKARQFIPQTKYLYIKPVRNDIEAVIVEANFIKSYQPRYNSIIKDDRSNIYLVFTNYPHTKIRIVHATDILDMNLDDYQHQVFGPYTSGTVVRSLYKQIRYVFGFCLDPGNLKHRACFNYHIGHCPGVCTAEVSIQKYRLHLGKIKRFLSGKFNLLIKSLNADIKRAIKKEEFEKAQIIKTQVEGLQHCLSTQNSSLLLKLSDATDQLQHKIVRTLNHPHLKTTPHRLECYDLAHLQGDSYVGAMVVFLGGQPSPTNYRHFNIKLPDRSDPFAMKQIIERRLAHKEWGQPDLIVLDGGLPQLSIVSPSIPPNIPVIALAKKRETIYFYDNQHKPQILSLPLEDPVLNLFRSLRDEAHRHANSFHRQKRRQKLIANNI